MKPGRLITAAGFILALALSATSTAQQAPLGDCLGREVTIQGTGPIVGTPGRDVIAGSPGRDTIRGGGGKDVICGALGKDKLYGGAGPDIVSGGAGRDLLVGDGATVSFKGAVGGDDDRLYGNGGADVIIGDAFGAGSGNARNDGGNDLIIGNDGSYDGRFTEGDLLIGGSVSRSGIVRGQDGTDELRGAGGPDLIIGDNASLRGGPTPRGEGSDDVLTGGLADDVLVGGAGDSDDCFGRKGVDGFTTCETDELSCPRGASDGVRPEEFIGAHLDRARRIVDRFSDGCFIRVLVRDGRSLPATEDFSPTRINVSVRNDRVIRILGVH